MKNSISIFIIFSLLVLQFPFAHQAQAAVSNWQKSFSVIPQSPDDFATSSFQQSLRNMKADGANYVNLIIPYYQSNVGSTDIGRGGNTPSDASLVSAIQYAHSIGMHVSIALYLEDYNSDWRAYINPGDRDTWYRNYGNLLVYYGNLAQAQGVEQFVLGAELISMASGSVNADNTQRWNTMIANVRTVYSGTLTYSANRGDQQGFGNEVQNIGFWDKLDLIGVSGYYSLWGDGSVASLESDWEHPNSVDIGPIAQKYGKPVIFTEIGYRSVSGAHNTPWDSSLSGTYDPQEQVNDYTALFEYWNNYSYLHGASLWWWKSSPNGGGNGDTDYTPQNKPAESVLKQWWIGSSQPSGPVAFAVNGSANPSSASIGQQVSLATNITETTGFSSADIIDLEVYVGSVQVFQKFFSGQNFTQGQSQTYTSSFTPSTNGTYTFKIGIFNSDWSKNYLWSDSVSNIVIGGTSVPPPSNPPSANGKNVTDVWWPSDGSHVTGLQPFKAMVEGIDVSNYTMYWQVDGGARVQMANSTENYPHKESLVDLRSWHWNGAGSYTVNFVSTDATGNILSQKSVKLFTQ